MLLSLMYTVPCIWRVKTLTGPHSDTVQWRSQGGPVQFLMFGGLVIGSHGLVSSEQRTSRVTWAFRPHLAGHWRGRESWMFKDWQSKWLQMLILKECNRAICRYENTAQKMHWEQLIYLDVKLFKHCFSPKRRNDQWDLHLTCFSVFFEARWLKSHQGFLVSGECHWRINQWPQSDRKTAADSC